MRKLQYSKGFTNSIKKYFAYKVKQEELIHAKKKIKKIFQTLRTLGNESTVLSKKIDYGNSKDLHYFTVEKHTIMLKVKPKSITVLYFVASKRIKKSIF